MKTKVTTADLLAQVIREYRYAQKLPQTEVARIANIKQSTLSQFETSPDSTKLETLFKILASLELELIVQPRESSLSDNKFLDEVW